MDELKEAWGELKAKDEEAIKLEIGQIRTSAHAKSEGVIETLNKKLKQKTWFVWGGIVLFFGFMYFAPNTITVILIAFIIMVYIISGFILTKERQVIKDEVDLTGNLKVTIETYYSKVKRILRYEEQIGLTLYPISASAGFIVGLNAEKDNSDFFDDWKGWAILAVVLLILTPLCHWFAKWMNRVAFGKYLKKLEYTLEELNRKEDDKTTK